MTLPTVHLNGTARAELMSQYETAYKAIGEALNGLYAANPNARDYYPQGPDAYTSARNEHDARCNALRAIQADMFAIYESLEG